MWAYVLLNLVASIACVALLHYLWNYFRDKYTVKKTRDIVGAQTEKYKEMMAEILESKGRQHTNVPVDSNSDLSTSDDSHSDFISAEEKAEMIKELRLLLVQ